MLNLESARRARSEPRCRRRACHFPRRARLWLSFARCCGPSCLREQAGELRTTRLLSALGPRSSRLRGRRAGAHVCRESRDASTSHACTRRVQHLWNCPCACRSCTAVHVVHKSHYGHFNRQPGHGWCCVSCGLTFQKGSFSHDCVLFRAIR